ncbi:MAG: hypothetical protein HYU41_00420 [Candidatus Rokubacteria bacterium]|nr:hypothetical protein [Candidatus Rokubacteria bacterium]
MHTTTMRHARRAVAALALAVLAATPAVAGATDDIVIEPTGLRRPLHRTAVERPVTWVNRSGVPAHIEFVGRPGEHRVFQVPGSIWAVFHRPGLHPYVVHLEGSRRAELRGSVQVIFDEGTVRASTCDGITVREVCIDP